MKKLVVLCVAIMVGLVLLMTFSTQELGTIGEDALSMPKNASTAQALRSGDAATQELVTIRGDDMFYQTLNGVMVGQARTAIDEDYPVFIRSGAALRFLHDEFWLIAPDATLLRSIEGMYLVDGYTYNQDMGQADEEEFILLQLPNGLHMNAQPAVLQTRLDTIDINANSILYFSEDALRWFTPYGETLIFGEETALFDATITIGEHSWAYNDLLRALGLLDEVIKKLDDGKDPDPELSQFEDILDEDEEDQQRPDDSESITDSNESQMVVPGGDESDSGSDDPEQDATADDETASKDTNPTETTPPETVPAATSPSTTTPSETQPTETLPPETVPSETLPPETVPSESGPNQNDPEESLPEATDPGETRPGETTPDGTTPDESVPDVTLPGETLPKETDPEESVPQESEPDETVPKESEPEETEPDETIPPETEPEETEPEETVPNTTTPDESVPSESIPDGTVPDEDEPEETEPEETEPDESEPEESTPGESEPGNIAPPETGPNETRPEEPGPEEEIPGEEGAPEEGGDSEGSESLEPEYVLPQVTLDEFEPWCYAIKGKLAVEDDYGAILKGVRITVYRSVKGMGAVDNSNPNMKVYPASSYEGTSAMMRKTYNGSQELALATLYPNTTYYVQFNYRYIYEETDPQTGDKALMKKTQYSDLYEITTTSVPTEPLAQAEWTEVFAALEQQVQFNGLSLELLADDYVAKPQIFTFENFKKNILPYINRLDFELEDPRGNKVVLSAGSSVVQNAQKPGGAVFISTRGMLTPDTEYTYTVTARDRNNNEIPLQYNTEMGKLYTRKPAPQVTIEEVANVMDRLTLKVTVEDPYDSLVEGAPLNVKILHGSTGNPTPLYGTWEDGTTFGSITEDTITLPLENPSHGKSYTFSVESLAFANPFNVQVLGNYDPQPSDADGSAQLPVMEDAVLGSLRCYTASLSSGIVQFNTRVDDLKDSSATISFAMGTNSTTDILPMIDAFTLNVAKKRDSSIDFSTTLNREELNVPFDPTAYDEVSKTLVISPGSPTTPKITLSGKLDQFVGKTLWEALLVAVTQDDSGNKSFSDPVQVSISIPSGTFESSTNYVYTIESLVIKGGAAYAIDTIQSNNSFTTKKVLPTAHFADFFIAADIAQLIDFWIDDPDGTILDNGLVNVMLYQVFETGDVLLDVQEMQAYNPEEYESEQYHQLRFDNIVGGAQYKLQFRAVSYNDADGFSSYANNVLLTELSFEGGSGLSGKLQLQQLDYTSVASGVHAWNKEAEEADSKGKATGVVSMPLGSGHFASRANNNPEAYRTVYLEIPEGATFVSLGCTPSSFPGRAVFSDANKKQISFKGITTFETVKGRTPAFPVPPNAKYVRFDIAADVMPFTPWDTEDTDTIPLLFYTTPQEDLLADINFPEDFQNAKLSGVTVVADSTVQMLTRKIPVTPGDVMCFSQFVSGVYMFSEAEQLIGAVASVHNTLWVVPNNVHSITIYGQSRLITSLNNLYIYRIASADKSKGFTTDISLDVIDTEEYFRNLQTDGSDLNVTLRLYQSKSIRDPDYDHLYAEKTLTDISASFSINDIWELEKLPADCGYKLVLSTMYKDVEIILDEIYFQTNSNYILIANQEDFQRINTNLGGNYLVVDDFTLTGSGVSGLYGTIDFQGHTITMANKSNAFSSLSTSGIIRNVVVSYPAGQSLGSGFVNSNSGLIENFVVRTEGAVSIQSQNRYLICGSNYGTIRNFIVRLGGDFTVNQTHSGLLMSANAVGGVLENGYIYGINGAGILFVHGNTTTTFYQGLFYENTIMSTVRNVYVLLDTWHHSHTPKTNGDASGLLTGRGVRGDHIYHAGNYYVLNSAGKKDYHTLCTDRRTTIGSSVSQLWHISTQEYKALSGVNAGGPELLHDINWQQDMLGEAFDVEHCVNMGFYPRLKFPASMARHQEYLLLPDITGSELFIVNDKMAEDPQYSQGNESGVIQLRFENPGGNVIRDVTIGGLTFKDIPYQGYGEDGLYDVFVSVEANDYLSKYTVTEFRYSTGSGVVTKKCDYATKNIAFWKEVGSVEDWCNINDNMGWNYRLIDDLDFTGEAGAQIDGKKLSANGTVTFTGKIDGDMHTISNITMNNISNRGFIYSMSAKSELKNLIVENMNLTLSKGTSQTISGFVGESKGIIDNVHMRNCQVYGVGYMGILVGYADNGVIRNCSVADSTMQAQPVNTAAYVSAFAGYTNHTPVTNCYVRNSTINVHDAMVVNGIGGLIGLAKNTTIYYCYTNGFIDAVANYVGGLVGVVDSSVHIKNNWSNMELSVIGNNVGGLIACTQNTSGPQISQNLATGNLSGTGDSVHPIFGDDTLVRNNKYFANYGYDRQIILSNGEITLPEYRRRFSSADLACKSSWTDVMRMVDFWDYSPLTPDPNNPNDKPAFPMVYRSDGDGETLVWGQEEITLPGFDHTLELVEAHIQRDISENTYSATTLWTHPDITTDDILTMVRNGQLNLVFEGMQLGELAIDSQNPNTSQIILTGTSDTGQQLSQVTIRPNPNNAAQTYLSIETHVFEQALDAYELRVNCGSYAVAVNVSYGEPLYHDVYTIHDWNSLMARGHNVTNENFRICGKIDFGNRATGYSMLKLGRLVGKYSVNETEEIGFYNLVYNAGGTGDPWISKVTNDIGAMDDPLANLGGLTFSGFTADFSQTESSRTESGVVLVAENLINCKLLDIHITSNKQSSKQLGFISTVNNSVQHVDVDGLYLDTRDATSSSHYIGGIASHVKNGFYEITANNIVIRSNGQYVSALFGRSGTSATLKMTNGNCTLTNCSVKGTNTVSFLNSFEMRTLKNVTITDSSLETTNGASALGTWNKGTFTNITLTNVDIISTGKTSTQDQNGIGGLVMRAQANKIIDAELRNCTLIGNSSVGGIAAFGDGCAYTDCRVVDCTLISNCDQNLDNIRTGGMQGFAIGGSYATFNGCVVRGTTIQGYKYVGGIMGYGFLKANNCYIAEDVVISASGGSAGGIAGRSSNTHLRNCALGATVTGVDSVGGMVGLAANSDVSIENCYVGGSVYASSNYVGGLIGSVVNKDVLTPELDKNIIITASVSTPGHKASLWANSQTVEHLAPGDAQIYVWDQAVLNGQTAESILAADNVTGTNSLRLSESTTLVSAEQLRGETFYRNNWDGMWDYSGLPDYMPYPMVEDNTLVAYTNVDTAGNTAGIPTPTGNSNPDVTDVYASGVNTVNVEVMLPDGAAAATVTVNNTTYTTDAHGVVSLYYNFRDSLTVGDTTYTADSLLRSVMTSGDYWYYLDSGRVYYGEQVQATEKPTVGGIHDDVIHLWQGKALTRDGTVYLLNGPTATVESQPATHLQQLNQAVPFYSYTLSKGGVSVEAKVFHDFTLFGATRTNFRIFDTPDVPTAVPPQDGFVYDGVLYAVHSTTAKNYYSLLGVDGTLINALNNWSTGKISPDNIAHISNNFGYTNPVLLARYRDGTAVGYNYATNELLFTTRSQTQMMMSFGLRQTTSLFSGLFNFGSESGESVGTDTVQSTPAATEGSTKPTIAPGIGGNGEVEPGPGGTNMTGGTSIGGNAVPENPTGQAPVSGQTTQPGGTANVAGTSTEAGTASESVTGNPAVSGSANVSGTGDTAVMNGAIVAGNVMIPDSGSYYLEGSGVYVDGELAMSAEDTQYRSGEGVYANGELVFAESLSSGNGASNDSAGGSNSGAGSVQLVEVVHPVTQAQQLTSLLDENTLVYSLTTGKVESVESVDLLNLQEEVQPEETLEPVAEENASADPNGKFVINQSESVKLTGSDQRGILLLVVLAITGGIVLTVIYFKAIRKKRK